ncbi:hypothetical protein Tco_0776884 [Tanacetum coccineum]
MYVKRHTPTTTEPSRNAESPSLDDELAIADSEMKSDEKVTPVNKEKDASNKELTMINAGVQDEGQAGSDPGKKDKARLDQTLVMLQCFNLNQVMWFMLDQTLNPMDLAVSDSSTQQNPEHLDEEFTTNAYPNVQENLKLPNEDQKPQEEDPEKTNAESEVQSMVIVPIHQDTSSVPPMTTPVTDLTTSQSDSPNVHAPLPTSTTTTTTITTTTTLPPPPQPQQSTTYPILLQRISELEQHMATLIQENFALEERLKKHGSRLYKLENLNIPQKVSKVVDEIVTDVVDWAMQAPLRARFSDLPAVDMKEILQQWMFEDNSYKAHEVHKNLFEALQKSLERDYSNQLLADLDEARRKKRKKRDSPRTPSGLHLHDHLLHHLQQAYLVLQHQGSEASSLSKTAASSQQTMAWTTSDTRYESAGFTGTQETTPRDNQLNNDSIPHKQKKKQILNRLDFPSSNVSDVENNWASALVLTYEPPAENLLLAKTGDMMTFMNWYCQKVNKTMLTQADFEGKAYELFKLLPRLSFILVPEGRILQGHLNHLPGLDIRMLSSAVKLWTRNLVIRQWVKDFQLGIESYQKQLNLTKPGWDAIGFEFKHDYTIIDSPRVVEALDYRVKEYKVNQLNPGINTRFWTEKDVERSKEFLHAIEQILKTRRILRNLEYFVGGQVRDIDYRLLQRTE